MSGPTAWDELPALLRAHRLLAWRLARRGVEPREGRVAGRRAYWYDGGPKDAPATLFVHGLGDSSDTYYGVLPSLARGGRRVLALDLVAHGRTERPAKGYATIDEQAAFVHDFLDHVLPDEPVTIVGQSMGGWVAARAARHPERFTKLVLVAPAGLPYEGMWDRAALLDLHDESDVELLWRLACFRVPWQLRVARDELLRLFQDDPVRLFAGNPTPESWLTKEELSRIPIPAEILWGEMDGLVPTFLAGRYASLIRESRVTWMPRCGHAPQFEQPAEFLAFLESVLPSLKRPARLPILGAPKARAVIR